MWGLSRGTFTLYIYLTITTYYVLLFITNAGDLIPFLNKLLCDHASRLESATCWRKPACQGQAALWVGAGEPRMTV